MRFEHAITFASATKRALANGLSDTQAQSVERAVLVASAEGLEAIVLGLSGVEIWPLQQPFLAEQMLQRADTMSPAVADSVLASIAEASRLSSFGWTNGTSEEIDQCFTLASRALHDGVADTRLSQVLSDSAEWYEKEKTEISNRFDDDIDV